MIPGATGFAKKPDLWHVPIKGLICGMNLLEELGTENICVTSFRVQHPLVDSFPAQGSSQSGAFLLQQGLQVAAPTSVQEGTGDV